MMTLLRPWVRKEHQNLVETGRRQPPFEHFDGVMADYPYVRQALGLQAEQHAPHSGPVHFNAEVIPLRMCRGQRQEILAVAETDLGCTRRAAAEQRIQLERSLRIDPELRPKHLQRALLGRCDAPGTRDEGADRAGRMIGDVQPDAVS